MFMTSAFVCAVIATATWYLTARYYRALVRQEEDSHVDTLNRLFEKQNSIDNIMLINNALRRDYDDLRRLADFGHLHLTWKALPSIKGKGTSEIAVVGTTNEKPELFFIIKIFTYVAGDEDDKDFAIREAEELIEIIKKA